MNWGHWGLQLQELTLQKLKWSLVNLKPPNHESLVVAPITSLAGLLSRVTALPFAKDNKE